MFVSKKSLLIFTTALLIFPLLASCNLPAQINVACDVSDLIQAINSANSNSDTTKLILDANCTYVFTNKDNEDGGHGPNALPIVTTNIIIEGNNAILLRSTAIGFRFFFITGDGSLRLEDITLENGYALVTSNDQPNTRGGAVYNDGGALNAQRSVFRENQAINGEGGAIYNLGTLTLEDNTSFEINSSANGGAIYNAGYVGIPAMLQDVRFDTNIAHDNGGAIYNGSSETGFLISGSTFDSNHSFEHGGAIFMEGGDLGVSNSTFLENQAGRGIDPLGDGGAIYSLAADVTLHGCDFNLQTAYGVGGIIYTGPGSELTLREAWGEENRACHGGGALYLEGEAEVLETTLKLNRAGGHDALWSLDENYSMECWGAHGGAIYNDGILTIDRSLLEQNYAMGDGNGVYNLADLTVVNSTFHHECCHEIQAIYNLGDAAVSLSTFVYNGLFNSGNMTVKNIVIAAHTNGCVNSGTFVDMNQNIALDPACPFTTILANQFMLFMDLYLSDNGGPTLTHRVDWNSPVINMASCSTVAGDPVTVDQRGEPRPFPAGSACDIGAFEIQDYSQPEPWEEPTQPPPTATPTPVPVTPMLYAPQNTTCRKGDSVDYEDAGYLLAGESAEVIGRNQEGTWLVINNPDWDGVCWILRAIVETEGDVDGTAVYISPPKPIKSPTVVSGCLVQQDRAGELKCVVPCPDGAEPGDPCTP